MYSWSYPLTRIGFFFAKYDVMYVFLTVHTLHIAEACLVDVWHAYSEKLKAFANGLA